MKSTLLLLTMMPICLLGQETLKIVDKKQKEIYLFLNLIRKSDTAPTKNLGAMIRHR